MKPFDYPQYLADFEATAAQRGLVGETVVETAVGPIRIWQTPGEVVDGCRGFISAGIHGDEPAGPLALLDYLRRHELPTHRSWVIAPALNPTGLVAGTRENHAGIDLNRDFLQQRSAEAKALVAWWQRQSASCVFHLSLHEDWEAQGLYLYALNTSSNTCFAQTLAERLGRHIRLQTTGPVDDHLLAAPGLILHEPEPDEPQGWPEAIWLVKRAPTVSYTLEAPGAFTPAERVEALRTGLALALELDQEAESGA
ncbi:MAG: succinylglutamate desuccinylase/aspartoacylase family protein [Verrucomicrobiota bacterium JB022]|nr:succinylglutamate desuccinylase/aspartoacylase family protein [Verrucomicrobiota bacterium JB022]